DGARVADSGVERCGSLDRVTPAARTLGCESVVRAATRFRKVSARRAGHCAAAGFRVTRDESTIVRSGPGPHPGPRGSRSRSTPSDLEKSALKSIYYVLAIAVTLGACAPAPVVIAPAPEGPAPTAMPPAPEVAPDDWWLLDPLQDGVYGTSAERAYDELL